MKKALVVGGGLSGLCAATTLLHQGYAVHLVERESTLGGLLKSIHVEDGRVFDFGTHFISKYGIPLAEDLFSPTIDTHHLPQVRAGNFFGGRLNEESLSLDLTTLPRETHDRIVAEMLTSEYSEQRENLLDFYTQNYSQTLGREIISPLLKKFLPCELSDLECDGARPFLNSRFIALNQEASARLKSLPEYDRLFAWRRSTSQTALYYPKSGGMGAYIEDFATRLQQQGLKVSTGKTVESLETQGDIIKSATLSDGVGLNFDLLVWTLPSSLFLRAVGRPAVQTRPVLQPTTLVHLELSKPFLTDLFYLYSYDQDRYLPANLRLFRTTLYPNFRQDGRNLCTLELFGEGSANSDIVARCHQELVHLGVAAQESKVTFSHGPIVFPGFPIWTHEFSRGLQKDVDTIESAFSNVHLLAKARGKAFLMTEIVAECLGALS